jgi:hypothetical protein
MSLETNLIFLVIFGVAGYFVQKIWDFNPYQYWERFGIASMGISLILAYLPAVFNPEDVVNNVNRLMNWFVAILPGTIVGDLAGQIVSNLTGGGRR